MARDLQRQRAEEEQRAYLDGYLHKLQVESFFGTLTLKLEGGIVKRVIKEESIVPPAASVGPKPVGG